MARGDAVAAMLVELMMFDECRRESIEQLFERQRLERLELLERHIRECEELLSIAQDRHAYSYEESADVTRRCDEAREGPRAGEVRAGKSRQA